jgi:hypothetical protein
MHVDTNLTLLRNKVQKGNILAVEFMLTKSFIKQDILLTPCISFTSSCVKKSISVTKPKCHALVFNI